MNTPENIKMSTAKTTAMADPIEQRKRGLSDNAEPTGVSPDTKRPVMERIRIEMPPDDASTLEWHKSIFSKIGEMYDTYEELKRSLAFSNNKLTECENEITGLKEEVKGLQGQLNILECEKEDLKIQCRIMTENHIKTETRLREQNLVFEGIIETYGEDKNMLYNKIVRVLNHMMVLNGNGHKIPLSKIQRLGPFIRGQTRPVVCHFVRHHDVEVLMRNRMQLPDKVYLREDFPSEVEDRRRVLRPIFNKAKKMPEYKHKCRLTYDRLILDGKAYTVAPVNNLHKLPLPLHPRASAERENKKVIVFFTQGSPFSNFHQAPFVRNNVRYVCNEQYIQSRKAELFDDDETHAKIMQSSNPFEIKALGSRVKQFVKQRWEQLAKQVIKEACQAKFTQNADLLDILVDTDNKVIGEASKDPFWGIGKSLDDPNVLDNTNWMGENLLGNTLMYLRDQLK